MNRVRVSWVGSPVVGDGLSTFYLTGATTDVSAIKTFFSSIAAQFPPGITWTIPTTGDDIDEATGQLVGGVTFTGGGIVASAGTDSRFARGVGARIKWSTNGVVAGRRVQGSTFLVPLEAYMYDADGSLATTNLQVLQNATTALAAMPGLGVWHRPSKGGSNGSLVDITSGQIPDKVSTLRSRRV